MIKFVTGDIFQSNAEALVNTINTEGIIGKGIAAQFKKRYPNNFKAYEKACQNGDVSIGHMFTYIEDSLDNKKIIINFPTKKLWKDKSKLEEITKGLEDLASVITSRGITSIAIPPLGCGLGGLQWNDVKAEIERVFAQYTNVTIYVYEPLKRKQSYASLEKRQEMSELKSALLTVFMEYMKHAHSTDISSIETHNLLYFLQIFGVDLTLKFAPFCYGIYCNNLDEILYEMDNIWIQRFKKNSTNSFETFRIPASVKLENIEISESYKIQIQKLFDFLEGYENPLGMELLATIHWLLTRENIDPTVEALQEGIKNWCIKNNQNWGNRKLYYFTQDIIEKALEHIQNHIPQFTKASA